MTRIRNTFYKVIILYLCQDLKDLCKYLSVEDNVEVIPISLFIRFKKIFVIARARSTFLYTATRYSVSGKFKPDIRPAGYPVQPIYLVPREPELPRPARGAGGRAHRDPHHVERALRDRDRGDDGGRPSYGRT